MIFWSEDMKYGSLGAFLALGVMIPLGAMAHNTYYAVDCTWGVSNASTVVSGGRQFETSRPAGMETAVIWGEWASKESGRKNGTYYGGKDIELFTNKIRGFLGRPDHGADNVVFMLVPLTDNISADAMPDLKPADLPTGMTLGVCPIKRADGGHTH